MISVLTLVLLVAQTPQPAQLLQAYVDSAHVFESAEFRLQFTETYEGPAPLNGVKTREGSYLVRHDNGRWKMECKIVSRFLNAQGSIDSKVRENEVCVNDERQYIQLGREGKDNKLEWVMAWLSGLPEDESIGSMDYFTLLFGVMHGNGKNAFIDVLRNSTLGVEADKQGWRLDSRGKYGRATIVFDNELRVTRLHFLKTGDDLHGFYHRDKEVKEKKVSDFPQVQPDNYEPGGKISSFETTLEVSKFEESDGAHYPSAATITTATNYQGGQRSAVRFDMRIDRFRRGGFSADDFLIKTVPDGYVVQVQDHPNVEFEWKNGAILKTVNSETQSRLGSARFYSTFSIVGYLLAFAICLIAVAYLGSWAYRRRHA